MRSRKKLDFILQHPAIYSEIFDPPSQPYLCDSFFFSFWACLREPTVPKTLAESLARVNQVYVTGPASRSTQWSPLWDEPTAMDRLADPDTYKTINNTPACFNIDVESLAFITADAPSPSGTLPNIFSFSNKKPISWKFLFFWAFPKCGVLCGLHMENSDNALITLFPGDLVLSWPENTAQKTKTAFSTSLKKAMQSGLQLRLKGERLSGYSVILTMDIEALTLMKDVCETAGHSTHFICLN